MKLLFILIIAIFCFPFVSYSANNAGAFIEKGIQARAAAMGMSQVSIAHNSDTVYWNPALMAFSSISEICLMETNAYETQFFSLQGLFRILNQPIGIALINAYMNGIEETALNTFSGRYDFTGNILSYHATALYLGSSYQLLDLLSIGGTIKYLQESSTNYRAFGIGLDIGIAYLFKQQFMFGATAQNIIKPTMKRSLSADPIDTVPTVIKLGASTTFFDDRLLTSFDLNVYYQRSIQANLGLEYRFNQSLSVRSGFNNDEFGLGVGLNLDSFILDFSWNNPRLFYLDDIYKISFAYQF